MWGADDSEHGVGGEGSVDGVAAVPQHRHAACAARWSAAATMAVGASARW
jgi:hypothetical protein